MATRYGSSLVDGINMLVLLLPGVGVTYMVIFNSHNFIEFDTIALKLWISTYFNINMFIDVYKTCVLDFGVL